MIKLSYDYIMDVKIGFIGTGLIATSIVDGINLKNDLNCKIYLSPRNAEKAKELSEKYKNITVARSNQEVLDNVEWVVISILPSIGEEVLKTLLFKEEHRVINLMSNRKLTEIQEWIGKTKSLVHMVPLPFISKRIGPIVLYPQDNDTKTLFGPLGDIIEVDKIEKVEALAAITALMGSYYKLLLEVSRWGENQGLSEEISIKYTTYFFQCLSYLAGEEKDLEKLIKEMTPGGLNVMALRNIENKNSYEPWIKSLELAMKKLKNPS